MRKTLYPWPCKSWLFALCLLSLMFSGCKADVDLNNIDPSAKVEMGLALPIGTMTASIGDFLGGEIEQYIHVREDGVLYYQDSFHVARDFHGIDLTQYLTSSSEVFTIGERYPSYVGMTLPAGETYVLEFPMTITLNNINTQLDNERLDSIYIQEARFTSVLSVSDMALPYNNITKFEVILEENMRRTEGNTIDIPLSGSNYDTAIPIDINNFFINLMKDKNATPGNNNVINQIHFTFRFTIVPEQPLVITSHSAINYNIDIEFLDYHAIWGWFKPSNKMLDEDELNIAEEWDAWETIKELKLPLAEPSVELNIESAIGAPLLLNAEYVYVKSAEGESRFATFDGNQRKIWAFADYVDPINDPYDHTVTNTYTLNETKQNGNIDEMFSIRPDIVGYKYEMMINQSYSSTILQHRLTKNTNIEIEAITTIPLIFHEGVELAYSDSINEVDLTQASLDSLLAEIKQIDSVHVDNLKLMLHAENHIPFDIDATFTFLDEQDNPIDFNLTGEGNTLHIAGPTAVENQVITQPGESTLIIDIDQNDIDKLASIKTILYHASIGNNTATVRVLDTSGLKFTIGVAANVEALLNLDFTNTAN